MLKPGTLNPLETFATLYPGCVSQPGMLSAVKKTKND